MAQFRLNWNNIILISNPNVIGQRASYRQKSLGGSFITTGFTPANDLSTTIDTVDSANIAVNKVWEFKIESICTIGGPIINTNGLQEKLKFACITPVITHTANSSNITLNVTGLDITKAQFILKKVSDNSIIYGPVTINRVGNSISAVATGLIGSTAYYWETVLFATVSGIEIDSVSASTPIGIGTACISTNFTTEASICLPVTGVDVSSINIEA